MSVALALQELAALLGANGVLTGDQMVASTRLWDSSGVGRDVLPLALLRPKSVDEISAAMAICNRYGIPVVPQGGLTGLAGGANAGQGQIALSLSRFVGVETIDPLAQAMVVRAGTILEVAQDAAAEAGFLLPVDLGARGSCQIGGIISTNAGGVRVIRHGMTRDNLMGIEVVLADGTVLSHLSHLRKDNTGYDLKHLFCGAEGTLGIVTRAVFRLTPLPPPVETAICAVEGFGDALALLQMARRMSLPISAFEAMWRDHFLLGGGDRLFPDAPPLALIVETEGPGLQPLLERAFEEGLIHDGLVARSEAEARRFWEVRECAHPVRDLRGLLNLDISLPPDQTEDFVTECRAALAGLDDGVRSYFFGHVGDGNLHVMVDLPNRGHEGEDDMQQAAYALVAARGGSISAEHGIGTIKRRWLDHSRSAAEIAAMRAVKAALDPAGIMNPGKLL